VLVPLDENGMQRPVEIVPGTDARYAQRFERIEHRTWPDGNAGGPQRACKVEDVLGEATLRHLRPLPAVEGSLDPFARE
jgi:hypothetical protein